MCTITVRSRPATEITSVVDPGVTAVPHRLALAGEPEVVDGIDDVDDVAMPEWAPPLHELRAMAAAATITSHLAGPGRGRRVRRR
jgi:hypothetical protein